jgi:hypothetical protein
MRHGMRRRRPGKWQTKRGPMVDSALEARTAAAAAAAALRLVNEVAAEHLIAAVERGETRARLRVDAVSLPQASGRVGRLYDDKLLDALDEAGSRALARACRIFEALGFHVSTAPEVDSTHEEDRVVERVTAIRITSLELGFATAALVSRSSAEPLLRGVALPAAYLWRARAEAARRIEAYERKALAAIAERAERGEVSCRLGWRLFGSGRPEARQLQQLAERLGGRGFRVEVIDASAALHVTW